MEAAPMSNNLLITPEYIGRLAYVLAEEAGFAPTSVSIHLSFDTEIGPVTHVRLVSAARTFSFSVPNETRAKSVADISAHLIEAYPDVFRPKVDPKAEMKARVSQALKDAIENLDKLRASLIILEEATHE
jgi:hypothetical protein